MPPTPRSGIPTLAPPSGCPAVDVTRPLKTTFCAAAVLAVNGTARARRGRASSLRNHRLCMTNLACGEVNEVRRHREAREHSHEFPGDSGCVQRARPKRHGAGRGVKTMSNVRRSYVIAFTNVERRIS